MNAIDRSNASGKPEVCPVEPKPDYSTPNCPTDVAVLVERFRHAVGTAGKDEPRAEAPGQGCVCPTHEGSARATEMVSVADASSRYAEAAVEENAPRALPQGFQRSSVEQPTTIGGKENKADVAAARSGEPADMSGPEYLVGPQYQGSRRGRDPLEPSSAFTASEPPGAAILQSFLSQSSVAPATTPVNETPEVRDMAARVEKLETVIAETVSRILVSDPLHDAKREVRVQFAREVLPDTEVRLWRDAGRLHVEFKAPLAVAEGGLREALPRLGEMIQQRQSENALPLVTLRTGDFGGQPQDGRSRQSYWLPQEPEELA